MKIAFISDTHTFHNQITGKLPPADVLVHAGDLALEGNQREVQDALNWLDSLPYEHVITIAGNHDWAFQYKHPLNLGRVVYLEDSGVEINGKTFYGSPWQPEFCNWAFNVPRGPAIKKYWDLIPANLDVLITHGPPRGILDQSAPHKHSACLGCDDLFEAVDEKNPKIHVFGHIHGGYGKTTFGKNGTVFLNAAICNEIYRPVNEPWVLEI